MPVKAPYEDMNLKSAISRFLLVLKEFASEAFKRDILPFEPLLTTLSDGMTVSEMIRMIGNRPLAFPDPDLVSAYPKPYEKEKILL
jgi:hypothetical protein